MSRPKDDEDDLKRLGIERLYIVGSMARDEATDEPDVDLFFDCQTDGTASSS